MRNRPAGPGVLPFVTMRATLAALAGIVAALSTSASAGAKGADLYALRYGAAMNLLVPYDPVRLVPSGPAIRLGQFSQSWSISGDRSRLVVAAGGRLSRERGATLRFVDLVARRVLSTVTLPGEARRVAATTWVRGRVLAVAAGADAMTVYAVDPARGAVTARTDVDGALMTGERTRGGLALLLTRPDEIGPATIAVVDGAARVRTVQLDRITAGLVAADARTTVRRPGLAVSPAGDRAYVFGAGEPAAVINLRTLAVRYSTQRTTAVARKLGRGSVRVAASLPDGRIVVAGYGFGRAGSTFLRVVDPRTWESRALRGGPWFRVGGGVVFARGLRGTGLRIIRPDGSVAELFAGRSVGDVFVVGPRAFVTFYGKNQRAAVIEFGSLRIVRQTVPAHPLVGRGQAIVGLY